MFCYADFQGAPEARSKHIYLSPNAFSYTYGYTVYLVFLTDRSLIYTAVGEGQFKVNICVGSFEVYQVAAFTQAAYLEARSSTASRDIKSQELSNICTIRNV